MAPKPGDPETRPAEVFTIIHATPAMLQEEAILATNAAVAWLNRDQRGVGTADVAKLLKETVGALPNDIDVVRHYPEPYLVSFIHMHHCALACSKRTIPVGNGNCLQVRPWTLESHAEHVEMKHHVRLCLKRIPLYTWNDHVAAQAIGHGCSLDYIEPRSLRKENTEYLACWAWTSCPSKVPRVNWVTLPARASNVPEVGRRGLERRVIIHLAIDEDHTGETMHTREHDFHLSYINGEAQLRDRRERITGNDAPRKDKDDDDRDDGTSRCGRNDGREGSSWRDRFHSKSRPARQRDDGRDSRPGYRDGRDGRGDGRRRPATIDNADLRWERMELASPSAGLGDAGGLGAIDALPLVVAPATEAFDASAESDAGRGRTLVSLGPHPPGSARGRSPSRSSAPGSSRRSSIAARTPPCSPTGQSSPSSVLPASPFSPKASDASASLLHGLDVASALAPLLDQLLAPTQLCSPTSSLSAPPGFIAAMFASDTPNAAPAIRTRLWSPGETPTQRQLFGRTPPTSTPPVTPAPDSMGSDAATSSPTPARGSLFADITPLLLSTPSGARSPRLELPANRRKTLAGGFTVRRSSIRIKNTHRGTPITKMAEQNLCRRLGIVEDNEDVTEQAVQQFMDMFSSQVPSDTIAAMRALFCLDYAHAEAVEAALLAHGGHAVLDLDVQAEA
jgi:hypothetical protein